MCFTKTFMGLALLMLPLNSTAAIAFHVRRFCCKALTWKLKKGKKPKLYAIMCNRLTQELFPHTALERGTVH